MNLIKREQTQQKRNLQLTKSPPFWWALLGPLITASGFALYIGFNASLNFTPGYEGLNNILIFFKVPLGILALIFPFVAFVATSHRSNQTKEQIDLVNSQNNFTNFYKHKEEFLKILSGLEDSHDIKFYNTHELYRELFPDNSTKFIESQSKPSTREKLHLEYVTEEYNNVCKMLEQSPITQNTDYSIVQQTLVPLLETIFQVGDYVNITIEKGLIVHRENSFTIAFNESEPFLHFNIVRSVIISLNDFCQIDSPRRIASYNFSHILKEWMGVHASKILLMQ